MVDFLSLKSLPELKSYREYLVQHENEIQAEACSPEGQTESMMHRLEWYKDELVRVDALINEQLRRQIRREEDAAASRWFNARPGLINTPKPRGFWRNLFSNLFWPPFN